MVGGIASTGAVTLIRSEVSANRAYGDGYAIYSRGELTLIDSTVSDNDKLYHKATLLEGGGTIQSFGTMLMINSTVSNNYGNAFAGYIIQGGWYYHQ